MLHCTWVALIWNWLAVLVMVFGAQEIGLSTTEIVWASMYVFFGVYGSFLLWWQTGYQANKNDDVAAWLRFWIYFGCHTGIYFCLHCHHAGFCIVIFLGIPATAAGGLINFFNLLSKNCTKTALFVLPGLLLWGFMVAGSLYLMREFYFVWRNVCFYFHFFFT